MSDKVKKGSKVKKILIALGIIGATAAAGFGVYKAIGGTIGGGENPSINEKAQLSEVVNVNYDDNTCLLKWNDVQNADSYNISINGSKDYIKVEDNVFSYVPTKDSTTFSVQALDSQGLYKESNWSDTVTYNVPANEVSYASVNSFVQKMIPYKLEKLVSINIDGNKLITRAVFTDSGKTNIYSLRTTYDHNLTSIKDAMTGEMPYTRIMGNYDVVKYNSAESLLKSNSYVGKMEELRQQGYKLEVVSQQTSSVKENAKIVLIDATYKATKGDDVKYIQSNIKCQINEETPIDKVKFTTKLENPETRRLVELDSKILAGDEITVAQGMENAKYNYTTDTQSAYNYNVTNPNMAYASSYAEDENVR